MLLENNNASISVNVRESIFQNLGNFCLWNPEYCALDSRKGNQNHASDCNPEYKFHCQGIPNPESSSMESGIYGVKSRDQDCLGFPRTGRGIASKTGQRCSPSPGLVTMAIMTRFQSSYTGLELTEQCPRMGRGPEGPPNNLDRHV